ncbi:phytoceramidase [Capsaspora owczarzaki ATCC 30864]|uniref:Phytoceramidase n=1 Tax=Capsaspora owczarzaki (strain ATCC 30864) TaxID=595528 RepID=A0A0D2X3Q1_CAPO3|nr:phytoceramidase [Capsaspora owczarzaki ATCC 30864]KJE94699.1 phytoceramidase [Capsaspora owczarzaki ATCC 30864]|eukprot:XP_004346986.2 phytoceramidase [Capsaspora owczarzaki ATCC 30864]
MRFHDGNSSGFWGNTTSTLDWCEHNYAVCHYIAEFWNTISNVPMALLALYGMYCVRKYGFETRFLIAYFGLFVVGFGSWCFHGTLDYSAQLLDELPMIYGTCVFVYCVLEDRPKSRYGWPLILGLFLYAVVVTVVYLFVKVAEFHQVAYGLMVALIVFKCCYHYKIGDLSRDPLQPKIFFGALIAYLGGFALWNIDNIFCGSLRAWRAELPFPLDGLLELHAWWHIGTGYGTYLFIVTNQMLRSTWLRQSGGNDSLDAVGGSEVHFERIFGIIPYVVKDTAAPRRSKRIASASATPVTTRTLRSKRD